MCRTEACIKSNEPRKTIKSLCSPSFTCFLLISSSLRTLFLLIKKQDHEHPSNWYNLVGHSSAFNLLATVKVPNLQCVVVIPMLLSLQNLYYHMNKITVSKKPFHYRIFVQCMNCSLQQ